MSSEYWDVAFPKAQNSSNDCISTHLDPHYLHNEEKEKDRSIGEVIYHVSKYLSSDELQSKIESESETEENASLVFNSVQEGSDYEYRCSTPNKIHTSEKYELPQTEVTNHINDDNCASHEPESKKNEFNLPQMSFSTSSSDLMDKISLIDIDKSGIDSLLSLPSPEKSQDGCQNPLISPITERTEKSDASYNDTHNTAVQKENTKVIDRNTRKRSKFAVNQNRKFSNSSCESPASFSSNQDSRRSRYQPRHQRSLSKSRSVSLNSETCLPNFSLSSSSPSVSFMSSNFPIVRQSQTTPGKFRGRRCISALSLNDDRPKKSNHKSSSNLKYSSSHSVDNLPKKVKDYSQVTSKVRKYIEGIKSSECSRRASPIRSSISTPCDETVLGDIVLLDENLISIDGNEHEVPDNIASLVHKLNSSCEKPEFLKNVLSLMINERKLRTEQEQTVATLQLEYDNLLAKHAQSQNLIDELRLQALSSKDPQNITNAPPYAFSCCSTPRMRRYSAGFVQLDGNLRHLSSSQPNLVKSTTFHVTEPTLGLSIDQSGSLHFLPTPFESNVSYSLTNKQSAAGTSTPKDEDALQLLAQPNQNGYIINPQSYRRSATPTARDNHINETNIDDPNTYVNISGRLQDFSLLLSANGLSSDEICKVWQDLLSSVSISHLKNICYKFFIANFIYS